MKKMRGAFSLNLLVGTVRPPDLGSLLPLTLIGCALASSLSPLPTTAAAVAAAGPGGPVMTLPSALTEASQSRLSGVESPAPPGNPQDHFSTTLLFCSPCAAAEACR